MVEIKNRFERYPSYKDSGVEWLREIPEGWDIVRFKHLAKIKKGKLPQKIVSEKITNMPPYMSMEYLRGGEENQWVLDNNAEQVKKGETLLLWDGSNAGEFIKSRKGVISSTVALIKFSNIHKNFSWYYTKILERCLRQETIGMGIPHVDGDQLKNLMVLIPPLPEQTTIANFLDEKTTKIESVIAQKEKLIALLKEQKQIIIQNAVTKGLNPNVKMKDSSVEWIWEIPDEWTIKRFKYLFTQSRIEPNKKDGIVTSFRDGQVTLRSNRRINGFTEAVLEQGYQGVKKGQLVLNSMDAFEGAIGVSESNGKCTPEYVVCDKINNNVLPEYFALLLREMALARYIQVICNAVRQRAVRIRFNNLKNRFIVIPPISVQTAIVNHIKTQSTKIDKAIGLQEKQITKLKEYKAILIDNAVTGKIKVC